MPKDNYKQPLKALQAELEELLAKRNEIDRRIVKVRQAIISLAQLSGGNQTGSELKDLSQQEIEGAFLEPKLRLVDALRWILKAAGKPLTALGIRHELEKLGYDISKPSLLSSIHITLDRIAKAGEAREVKEKGKKAYLWANPQGVRIRRIRSRKSEE